MCGIFGYFGRRGSVPSESAAAAALRALAHRGPDAYGIHRAQADGLTLGHARLSIIDPQTRSDQPFFRDDLALVFNGEIYNYRQLRAELQTHGVQFHTNGDTEVIAAGYAQWGAGVFDRLRGMFAIALYDSRTHHLHLARDEFGIKPLCLLERAGEVLFASEIKAIAALRSLSINGDVLADFLSWGFQMDNSSLYAGIRYLPPGTILTFRNDAGGVVLESERVIWNLARAPAEAGVEPTSAALRQTVLDSVEDHLLADVPIAVALSGGLDSSIVAAAAAQHHAGLHAFTFSLAPGSDPEVEHATLLAKHLGLEHRVAQLMPNKPEGWLRRVAWHLEEPIANINALVSYGLAAIVRAHGYKVVLVGEGADEVFGGYPWYRLALEDGAKGADVFQAYRKRRAQRGGLAYLRPFAVEAERKRLQQQQETFAAALHKDALKGFLAFDQATQLQYSQLLRVDRMYMAHGVEARVPFLYRSVLMQSAALPAHRMLAPTGAAGRQEKIALADAFRADLPEAVFQRPKFGERGTVNIWDSWLAQGITGEFRRCVEGAELLGARQLLDEYIDWGAAAKAQLAAKDKFVLALLIEAVDSVLLARQEPENHDLVHWEMRA